MKDMGSDMPEGNPSAGSVPSPCSASQILRDAADLLDRPGAWTIGEWARVTQGGAPIGPEEKNASCWCLVGAVQKISGPDVDGYTAALTAVQDVIGTSDIIGWNDTHSKPEVVAKLREAAEACSPKSECSEPAQ